MRARIICLLVFAFIAAATSGFCQTAAIDSTHVTQGEKFTLQLPGDWKEISAAVMTSTFKSLVEIAPAASSEHYDYGYQLASAPSTITYPYILVSIKKKGRVSENAIANLPSSDGEVKESFNKAADKLKSVLSSLKVGEMVYDRQKHILFMHSDMDVNGVGAIKSLTAVCLTEEGSINIYCYAKAAEFESYFKTFENVAKSIEFSGGLGYKPRLLDALGGSGGSGLHHIGRSAIIGGITGAVVALVIAMFKKKNAA